MTPRVPDDLHSEDDESCSDLITAPPRRMQNVRDLGGIAAEDGMRTRSGVLLRGDAPYAGDEAPALAVWPPARVIDLRSPGESDCRHPLAGPGTEVVELPLLRASNAVEVSLAESLPEDLDGIYDEILAVPARIVEALLQIARGPTPVLVHCSAGKDRTGVVVAVLLAALGASRESIVADYVRSEPNMPGIVARYGARLSMEGRLAAERLLADGSDLLMAPGRAIGRVLDVVCREAGDARSWLLGHGLAQADLQALRSRLLEPVSASLWRDS